ncbi:hypothetical protein F5Y16DRAFT_188971 [Xylariaceae sp. FL0255]|nr:hypothetical protein F5Y16DRAFT_188971 [Xylariaceae sp. FL0255]
MMSTTRGLSSSLRTSLSFSHSLSHTPRRIQPHFTSRSSFPYLHLQNGQKRTFIETAISTTQTLMTTLHTTTHLPWFLCIPLIGLSVNVMARLPFSIYNQVVLRRQAECSSLVSARRNQLMNAAMQQQQRAGPADKRGIDKMTAQIAKAENKAIGRLYGKLGIQRWKLYSPMLSVPIWLIAIDSLRRLCGAKAGLLSSLFSSSAEAAAAAAPPLDPTLAVEGALWFSNLSVPDPYHILPFALSAVLLSNLMPKTRGELTNRFRTAFLGTTRTTTPDGGPGGRMLVRVPSTERARALLFVTLMGVSVAVAPATMNLPAAIHLYWLASSLSTRAFTVVLGRLMPVKSKENVQRCVGAPPPFITSHGKESRTVV